MPDLSQNKPTPEEHGPGIDTFTPGILEIMTWKVIYGKMKMLGIFMRHIDSKAFIPTILFKDNEKNFQDKECIKDDSKEDKEPKDNKGVSNPDYLQLELENLEINDDTLELEGGDDAEDITKKLLDEQEQEDEETSTGCFPPALVQLCQPRSDRQGSNGFLHEHEHKSK
ncbi:Regulator of nonsense transcripts 2 [Fukomys damarensis]|uniref:Regulator of nonsense transcripts 2 n=1 Tax=Fukomys damarensis TaxID=885580 RepID=A0A091E3Y6_FUKDA|nr:Regulator of nonsense transcripts 2 [Fukomys damarensis]